MVCSPPGWGRGDVAGRPALEIGQGIVMETSPDFGLPLGIESFDGSLKARLPWGRKDGHDIEGQTQTDDTAPRHRDADGGLESGYHYRTAQMLAVPRCANVPPGCPLCQRLLKKV